MRQNVVIDICSRKESDTLSHSRANGTTHAPQLKPKYAMGGGRGPLPAARLTDTTETVDTTDTTDTLYFWGGGYLNPSDSTDKKDTTDTSDTLFFRCLFYSEFCLPFFRQRVQQDQKGSIGPSETNLVFRIADRDLRFRGA